MIGLQTNHSVQAEKDTFENACLEGEKIEKLVEKLLRLSGNFQLSDPQAYHLTHD